MLSLVALALASLVSAQSSALAPAASLTSYSYSNAATTLLTQTDSNGVITGQPTLPPAVTTQPALVTSQLPAALVPAGFGTGIYSITAGNQTFTFSVGVSGSSTITSLVTSTPTPSTLVSATAVSGTATRAGASASGTANASGAAAHLRAGIGALAAAGGVFGVFL